jgi:GT2 family glycosyltransferase
MNLSEEERQPLVSIITLNYNQAAVTTAFLESSKSLHYKNFEILVCDMASGVNPSTVFDPALYPHTRILFSDKNLGFAGGNNWGIRQAKGEFIFIVNNDTELTPDIIQLLLKPFFSDPSIAVVCPKIKYFDDPRVIQYAGFRPMNPFTGRTISIGDKELDNGQYDKSRATYGAHGCAMMVKRNILEKTGMFPEKFFLYYEEWDLSARILKAGYTIWYQAEAVIYHKESMSVGRDNPMKAYYHTRNRILYMRRNSNAFHLMIFSLFFCFFSMPKAIIGYLVRGEWIRLTWFMKGVMYNLSHSSRSAV